VVTPEGCGERKHLNFTLASNIPIIPDLWGLGHYRQIGITPEETGSKAYLFTLMPIPYSI